MPNHNDRRVLRSMTATPKTVSSTSKKQASPHDISAASIRWVKSAATPSSLSSSSSSSSPYHPIKTFPLDSSLPLPGLSKPELRLLRKKQRQLRLNADSTVEAILEQPPHMRPALEATLIFAQHEAGTAVCIDPAGWVLTCAHCIADTDADWQGSRKWLLFYTGVAVQVECRAWDPKRDLALLRIIAVESRGEISAPTKGDQKVNENDQKLDNAVEISRSNSTHAGQIIPIFPYVHISAQKSSASSKTPIICIGQPGRDDLESPTGGPTLYHLIEISEGLLRGMIAGVDPQDNGEIGALKHDAWTYWGHSGAPLLSMSDGKLVGLHSSWDDKTGMRHGVPIVAIRAFLQHCMDSGLNLDLQSSQS